MKFTVLVFFVMVASRLMAAPIRQDFALERAQKWMESNPVMKSVSDSIPSVVAFPGGDAAYSVYVVSLSPTGYLILNSDDRLPLVLSFSNDSGVDLSDKEGNAFRSLLLSHVDGIAEKIDDFGELQVKPPPTKAVEESDAVTELFGPFLETHWSQFSPFHDLCPVQTSGYGHAPSGCTMTSFAQILAFHCWPPRGTGSKTYTDSQGANRGTYTADFSSTYNWSAMCPTYLPSGPTPEERLAAADLLYKLGVEGIANYEDTATSAWGHAFQPGLKTHWYYEDVIHSTFVTTPTINERVMADMRAGFPASVQISGHQIVADGLMTDDGVTTCHFNYGWGGYNDGWSRIISDGSPGRLLLLSGETSIRPQMRVYPQNAVVDGMAGATVDLGWLLPKRRQHEVAKIRIYGKPQGGTWSLLMEDSNIISTRVPATVTLQEGQPIYHTTLVSPAPGTYQVKAKITNTQNVEYDFNEEFTLNVSASSGDADNDGLDDAWEIVHFGSIAAQDGAGDPDSDGVSNEREETLGSDPNDAAFPGAEYDGLYAWWKFDETSGTTASDSSGNGNDGLVSGAVWTNGLAAGALSFDGTDDKVVKSMTESTWPEFSVVLWVKAGEFGQPGYSGVFNNNSSNHDFQIDVDGGTPGDYRYHGSVTASITPVLSEWVHIAVRHDGTHTEFYHNGVLHSTQNNVADANFGQLAIAVNRGGTEFFDGLIDDVRVYSRALSASEIDAIYQQNAHSYNRWKSSWFSEAELADPAISGDAADVDGDHVPTLIEYGLGLDPKTHSGSITGCPVELDGANGWKVEFDRYASHQDIDMVLECSDELNPANWYPVAQSIAGGAVQALNGAILISETGSEPIAVRINVPLTASHGFIRWKVTRR